MEELGNELEIYHMYTLNCLGLRLKLECVESDLNVAGFAVSTTVSLSKEILMISQPPYFVLTLVFLVSCVL